MPSVNLPERPSPFTIPKPTFKFVEGEPAQPPPHRSMTVGGLILNLTIFADFYERASADIDRAEPVLKPWVVGNRDANADYMQREFRATVAIDRVRAFVLARYGEDLTIGTARRLLGDLIRECTLTVEAAEALPLETAMDRIEPAPVPAPTGVFAPAADAARVVLRAPGERPLVCGEEKNKLTRQQYAVVKALLEAGERGLSKDELDRKSQCGDARKILKRLAQSDPGWEAVIHFGGIPGGGYRIR
jgi:hypothetical protein